MSFLDRAKQALDTARDKAGELAEQHGDKVDSAIDKGGRFIDQKTHGKYSDTVGKVGAKAKDATERLAAQHGGDAPGSAPGSPGSTESSGSTDATSSEANRSRWAPRSAEEEAGPIPAPEPVDPPEPVRPPDPETPDRTQG